MKGVICGEPLAKPSDTWRHGCNAQPVKDGRCCAKCNETVVIPARVAEYKASQ
jgi:hypothetical protein